MTIPNRIVKNILGDRTSRNNKNLVVRNVGKKYMLYDTSIGEYLLGYEFRTEQEAKDFFDGKPIKL